MAAEVPAQRVSWHSCRMRVLNLGPPVRHTQPVRFPLPSAVEQAAASDKGAACRALRGSGCQCRGGRRHRVTTAVDGAPHSGCRALEDEAKEGVGGELPAPRSDEAVEAGGVRWDKSGAPAGPGLGDTVLVPVATRRCKTAVLRAHGKGRRGRQQQNISCECPLTSRPGPETPADAHPDSELDPIFRSIIGNTLCRFRYDVSYRLCVTRNVSFEFKSESLK